MTMNYLIAIVDDKHTPTALRFASAVLACGHNISRVFFFKNGVSIGAQSHPSHHAWCELAQQHGVELILCSAAAARRELNAPERSPFSIGGLGLYAEAQISGDKVVHFD